MKGQKGEIMENKNYELIKFEDGDFSLDVNVSPNEDTVWLTQKQMALLFHVSVDNISLHIKNILKDNELDNLVIEESSITSSDGKKYKTKLYNLEMIISVRFRIKSRNGIIFRRWALKTLKEYLLKGYVINENRVVVSNENYIKLKNHVCSKFEHTAQDGKVYMI